MTFQSQWSTVQNKTDERYESEIRIYPGIPGIYFICHFIHHINKSYLSQWLDVGSDLVIHQLTFTSLAWRFGMFTSSDQSERTSHRDLGMYERGRRPAVAAIFKQNFTQGLWHCWMYNRFWHLIICPTFYILNLFKVTKWDSIFWYHNK